MLLVCAVALIVGSIGAERLHDAYIRQASALLRNTAIVTSQLLAPDLHRQDKPALQEKVRALGRQMGYRITVIGPDSEGTVLADSEADPAHMVGHRFRPEVITAYTKGEGWDIRLSDTVHAQLLYYARRIGTGDQPIYLRFAIHLDDLNASLRSFYVSIALTAICCMMLAAIVSYFVARRQVLPIVEVTQFADAVARGHLDQRILRSGRGELATLAQSLNSMADSFTQLLSNAERGQADLRAVLASMREGVVATDASRRILLVNESATRLLQLPADPAGKLVWEVIRNEQIINAVDEVAASGQQRQFQYDPAPNQHFEVTICSVTYGAATQRSPGLIIVVHDITQAMRYQDLRKEFVANVSHELRTPLTVIKGYIETLRDGAISDPRKRDEYLLTIERHANQLTNLVSDLLELSRLDSQSALPSRTSVRPRRALPPRCGTAPARHPSQGAHAYAAVARRHPASRGQRGLPRAGDHQPHRQRGEVHAAPAGRSALPFVSSRRMPSSRSATAASASPRTICPASSSVSTGSTAPVRGRWAAPALACRSSSTSSRFMAAALILPVRSTRVHASGFSCPYPSRFDTAPQPDRMAPSSATTIRRQEASS